MSNSICQMTPSTLELLQVLQDALSRIGYLKMAGALLAASLILKKAHNIFAQAALNNFTHSSYDWRREIVVVTGGSGGLGDLLVRKLAKECIKVISIDIVPPATPLRKFASSTSCLFSYIYPVVYSKVTHCRSVLASNAFFYQMDITKTESIKRAADEIRRDHGDPTVLVNNAGAMSQTTVRDDTEEGIRRVFDINIIANFLLIKEFLPAMVKRNHGHVINIASMASFITGVRNVSYACTKVAVLALHEGLAQELMHAYNANKVRTR